MDSKLKRHMTSLRLVLIVAVIVAAIGALFVRQSLLLPAAHTGPLAVVLPPVGTADARTSGTLEIADGCVRLRHPDGSRSIVIWLNGAVEWNNSNHSISIGNAKTLSNGDVLAFGGQGGQAASLDAAGFWIQRPADNCQAEKWFLAVEALPLH